MAIKNPESGDQSSASDLSQIQTNVSQTYDSSMAGDQRKNDNNAVSRQATQRSQSLSIERTPTATQAPSFTIWQEIAFVLIICMAQLVTQAGLAQSIAPEHVIGDSLGTSNPGELSWLTAGYSLTVGTFILPAGRWGDLYGHRLLFAIGYAWYAIWSLVAGFAVYSHSLVFFATCRALQGIGPAILIPNGLAILGRTYPPGKRKHMAFALFGATAPGGFVVGAAFTGIFTEFAWWPWTFWTAGIVLAVCSALVFVFVPPTPVAGATPTIKELDPIGTALGISGLILFNFAWNQGPTVGWGVVYVYVLLIVGSIILTAFIWWELKWAEYPLLPTSAFTRTTSLVLACIAAGWGSFGIWVYYYWQFMQLLRGYSILVATAATTPTMVVGAIAAILTGHLLGVLGPGKVMAIAMVAFCVGNILFATAPVDQTYWAQTFVGALVTPIGMDMSFPAGSILLSNHMPRELQGIAASILCVIQNYSISIGLGMAGTVEQQVSGGVLLDGYRAAWYLAIGLDGLGIVCAIALLIVSRSAEKTKAGPKADDKKGKQEA